MNKYYECRGMLMQLVDDGRLVNVINNSFFKAEYVEDVLKYAKEVEDKIVWLKQRVESNIKYVNGVNESLKYADGQAYYQDLERIKDARRETRQIEIYLENLE